MKLHKSSRVLNDDNIFFGLDIVDFCVLGMFMSFGGLYLKKYGIEKSIFIIVGVMASFLISIRFRFRRKIIRDFIRSLAREDVVIPEIYKFLNQLGYTFWVMNSGSVGISFKISFIDCETQSKNVSHYEQSLYQYLNGLSDRVKTRVHYSSSYVYDINDENIRSTQIEEIGFSKNELIISFELVKHTAFNFFMKNKEGRSFNLRAQELLSYLNISELVNMGLSPTNLTSSEVEQLLPKNLVTRSKRSDIFLNFGNQLFSVIRVNKLNDTPFNLLTLSNIKNEIITDFTMEMAFQRVNPQKEEFNLRRKASQQSSGNDSVSFRKWKEAEETLEEVSLSGEGIVEYEWYIIVKGKNEEQLRANSENVINCLKPLAEAKIESVGAIPSFYSTLIGSRFHKTIKEKVSSFICLLPIFEIGERIMSEFDQTHMLPIHRMNHSLMSFNIFDPVYPCFNAIITGQSGSGKSVLTNLLTNSLVSNDQIRVFKVDVGGSHSKETELLKGKEYKLSMSEPSGINPFKFISNSKTKESVASVLSNFISVLVREQDEVTISKKIKMEVESVIKDYVDLNPVNPCIDDFLKSSKDFERKDLLTRWGSNGIFKNAFSSSDNELIGQHRLNYFNFSEIFEASDPDYGQGGFAAVMAYFNLEILNTNKRVVFIADETPFFIHRCFDFFKFSTANVRKLGHSVICVAQKTQDLIVNGDSGIIENSPIRFLFSIDGKHHEFKERFNLSVEDIDIIQNLKKKNGKFSDCFFQDPVGERVLRIILSSEEYWRFTSSREDNEKIKKLMEFVPNIKLEEAIRCLSI